MDKKYSNDKYGRAKKRVDALKGFYIHSFIYLIINAFILVNIGMQNDGFWSWGHFVTPVFWGLGLLIHASIVFKFNPLFGKNWEERQIKKYMA